MNPEAAVYLGTVAALSFVLKVAILFNIRIRNRISESFVLLCLVFVIQSATEFLAYFTYLKSEALGEFLIHIYLISLYFIFPATLQFALALTESKIVNLARLISFSIATLISVAYVAGLVVADLRFLGWSVISVPGPLYWYAVPTLLSIGLLTFGHLFYQYFKNENPLIRHNAKIYLFALLPIAIVTVSVVLLRLLGFNSSTAVSLPIATTVFLYIMLLHTNGNLFWMSTKLKSALVLLKMDEKASVDVIFQEIEKLRIQEALKLTDGQQKSAAELLGVPASTLNKRLSKYKIDAESFK